MRLRTMDQVTAEIASCLVATASFLLGVGSLSPLILCRHKNCSALAYVAQREGVAAEDLSLVNDFRRDSAILGRTFQAVTVVALARDCA